MTDLSNKVVAAKSALVLALGDSTQRYFDLLKFWFGGKWSKEEFDIEARKLLSKESIHLHNQFFVAILNKIDALRVPQKSGPVTASSTNRSSRKRKRSSRSYFERLKFEPYDLIDFLPEENMEVIRPPNQQNDIEHSPPSMPKYCVQEYFLPDIGFIMGRMLVAAWEFGLEHVDDAAAECVVLAVQTLLKNIISAVVLKRKQFKTTLDGDYFYDVGATVPDPFVRNWASRHNTYDEKNLPERFSLEKLPESETFFSACEQLYPVKKSVITINDVYKALQDRNIILSHSVYSTNMERISQMLH